jgi:hypothetical protein
MALNLTFDVKVTGDTLANLSRIAVQNSHDFRELGPFACKNLTQIFG